MAKYSSPENIYPESAPYTPGRSALRRRFGNRAITSSGPLPTGRPGDESLRDPSGKTRSDVWNSFFHSNTAPTPARMQATPRPSVTYYDEATPFGRPSVGTARSGTNFVSQFGYGGVRSAADMKAGRNAPHDLTAYDAQMKSPPTGEQLAILNAPPAVSQPPTSMNLLPEPRAGSPVVGTPRPSDYSPTPTADDYYGSILSSNPAKLSITTGVLDRLGKASTWDEPI